MGNIPVNILNQSIEDILATITLEKIFSMCQSSAYACAIYRLPNLRITPEDHHHKHIIIDLSASRNLDHLSLEKMGSGFIFHPFSSEHHQIKFINCDIHLAENSETQQLELIYSKIPADELYKLFNSEIIENPAPEGLDRTLEIIEINEQKNAFISLLEKTIQEIQDEQFQKVVIARNKTIELPELFNATEFFDSLTDQYKNAFVYMTYIPEVGLWIGATPETLININKNRQFQTVALAATQAYRDDVDLEETTWSQKDIEEQAMVSRYIINCFKKIRLREFEEIGPRTHLSGNLVHLKTDYTVDMDRVAFPQLGSVMLELLHPTSAVCGMPKEPAKDYLLKNEGFDREYFSGFLGPVNLQNESNIFVNLRCMKLMERQARLYAGAGIISNSNPEKEWNETEIKMQTLLKVLNELY